MDLRMCTAVAAGSGCLASATEDVARRLSQHFGDQEPAPDQGSALVARLKTEAHHLWPTAPASTSQAPAGMPDEVWAKMSPASRSGWWREHHPAPPVERRPRSLEVSAEQAQAFAAMPVHERLTAFRKMQQEG
jgi:hypothetical protein